VEFTPIRKASDWPVAPNLEDYEATRASFSWKEAAEELDHLPRGGINIAFEAVDRHAAGARRDHPAIRWLGKRGEVRDFTYADLYEESNRFADVLDRLGIRTGDVVFALCPRVPELYVTALGTLKHGAVLAPLFAAFGPEPIRQRIEIGEGRVIVTTERLYQRKVAQIRDQLPSLEHVIVIGRNGETTDIPGTLDFATLMEAASPAARTITTEPEDMALLHFTSGTTGTPKGAVHVHQAAVAHYATARYALDLHPDDVFWCTADPGWVTGTSYGIIAPLIHGVTSIVDEADFDADRWYRILQDERVTVWYTAPTAIRMLMKLGADVAQEYDLSALRFIASVGEPLNPEAVVWGVDAFSLPIHDNWWQTETGGIMIANYAACDIRPGSMGRPMPGIEAAVLRRDGEGNIVMAGDDADVITEPYVEGELALRPGWPSMFRTYLHNEDRYRKCFVGEWYRTGDLAEIDEDGYFWFIGRADDVIKTAGHLIGPFEVESVLLEHPAVAEAGVIGKPDEVAGNIIKAFVSLNPGYEPDDTLTRDIVGFARKKLGPAVAPREIQYQDYLPKTRSGKIMRRLLKARELGLPEGDTSTLERPAGEAEEAS
jgi:acetyl-CoA synthetase